MLRLQTSFFWFSCGHETGRAEKSSAGSGQQESAGGLWDSVKKAAFVIGSGILFLAAFGNSLTWHLQRFWGASGDFWQKLWTQVYLLFEGHDAALFFVGTMLAPTSVFWMLNGLLLLVDTSGKPSFITRYRIQEGRNDPVDPAKLRQAVRTVLFNQVLVSGPMVVLVYLLASRTGRPCGPELPTFHRGLMELALFSMLEEILFYYSHRLFHHPSLYKHFHKQHHEWTAPIGIVSIYAHPLEHVVQPPFFLRLLLVDSLKMFPSFRTHPNGPLISASPGSRFNQCFGVFGVLDRLHGTDSRFRQTKQYERHTLLTSLTPLTHSIPENHKKGQ
ncbi:fatty acid hydroxylase domain-containing protein 2 [Poecilia formosa]|uniref:fatty acid hydroxylase domain-containing protein 2 n=1 Tax=Poecilia formosa TaxID=48698 RepID=UPI0007B8C559|nr:PREDICTED: fatty acid hydroxylase domain-containing protein 2 [Poecilia formosa]